MPDSSPTVAATLHAAVERLGGQDRPGQLEMATAVEAAIDGGQHLLVQAGTGTGKSLAYLVPSILHDERVVVATATLALQHQLVQRDIPALLDAVDDLLGKRPSYAVLKGRGNYACLHRVRDGVPDDQGALIDIPQGTMGAEVLKLREWAEEQASDSGPGDRDSAPTHTDRVWQQVSVSHRECLGAMKCPYASECFAERARDRAMSSSLIVTNHSLLAIDAIEGVPMIPDYDVVVVDEAHELATRVTQAATDELSVPAIDRAARRVRNFVESTEADDLADSADALRLALDELEPGRIDAVPDELADALNPVRAASRTAFSAFPKDSGGDVDAARQQARGMVDEIRNVAERMAEHGEADVLWLAERDRQRGGNQLCIAPIQVWGPLRSKLLADKTVVFTSATLKLGGGFDPAAVSIGLLPTERLDHSIESADEEASSVVERIDEADDGSPSDADALVLPWRGIDVGSPFDYRQQAILYVAKHLPAPGRDGIGPAQIDEIGRLVEAAGGRTLGLFSSRRAAEAAAEALRESMPHMPILCQGDGHLSHLQAEFVDNPAVSLFGTLSLWQGLDVPGNTCQLVVIDRIPFPRPDDPLMSARARAAERAGGNGFMAVSATHAALLLAQGTGRLIRTMADRGVVAILDPRLVTARYGGFLRASLPPMWTTSDPEVALGALRRLSGAPTSGN
ncbi:MAG TPA: ATP-dependent DNA helicase [Nocardioidaceae bacterium]|nr:ATP-dependent DNA helicase [Nocardioidaceae bacterium]